MKNTILAFVSLLAISSIGQQVSFFNQGLLRQQNAAQDLFWLGISTNGGSGSVSNFSAGNFSPLFASGVTTPTTFPHLTFVPISQAQNLVYASPNGMAGNPGFRALVLADLPTLPAGGSVTNFSIGDLPPLFTSSVATPTHFPQVTFALTPQANNTFLAGPNGGGPLAPTFRTIATGDLPDITAIVRGDVSTTAPILYNSGSGVFSIHVADSTHDGYLSSSDWNAFNSKGVGTVLSITNAATTGLTLISNSNAPIPSIKSVSAGANISITDTGGTNLTFAASGIAGGSGLTDFMQYQTNYLVTFRPVASDVADGAVVAFTGFGDLLSIGFVNVGTATIRQNFNAALPLGPWIEMKTGASAGGNWTTFGTQTFNPVAAYPNGGLYFQTFICVRNTNDIRLSAGFSSAYTTTITNDTIKTNCAFFRYSSFSNDSTWHGVVCNATNQTFVDTGAKLVPDTTYLLQIYKTNGTTNVVFVVNRTNSVITTSNAPNRVVQASDLMGAFVGEETFTAAAKTNWLRYIGYTVDWVTK